MAKTSLKKKLFIQAGPWRYSVSNWSFQANWYCTLSPFVTSRISKGGDRSSSLLISNFPVRESRSWESSATSA